MKVVINSDFGGFGLSKAAEKLLGLDAISELETNKFRTNPDLINLIESKGSEFVSGWGGTLKIVEIPDNFKHWHIRDYDGMESIIASECEIHIFR